MRLQELMERVIVDGIKSVFENETDEAKIKGGVAGFQLCRKLNNLEEYEQVIKDRQKVESDLLWAKPTEDSMSSYWEHRYATLQVEWCYEIMKVYLRVYPLSAKAVLKYQSILEEYEKNAETAKTANNH